MRAMRFLWLDDEPQKEKASKELETSLNVRINFILLRNTLSDKIQEIADKRKPDLLIIDHRLDHTSDKDIIRTGSSVAELLRERDDWKPYPIVSITNVRLKDIDRHKQDLYDDIIEFNHLSQRKRLLTSIAKGFRKLRTKPPDDVDQLISLMKAPKDDVENIKRIVPKEVKESINSKDLCLSHDIYRWVRRTIIDRPGFLYNRLWAATTLGIKEQAFEKIENVFEKCKYEGIFSVPEEVEFERWWQSSIKETLFSRVVDSDEVLPWKLGYKLDRLTSRDRSKCHLCGKANPEIVGYTDEDANTPVPLHIGCSIPHPRFESALYFEEIRMQRPL